MTPEMRTSHFDDYMRKSEVAIYILLALLLSITALIAIIGAGQVLWQSIVHWTVSNDILRVLD